VFPCFDEIVAGVPAFEGYLHLAELERSAGAVAGRERCVRPRPAKLGTGA
jgi:hypothetical protein